MNFDGVVLGHLMALLASHRWWMERGGHQFDSPHLHAETTSVRDQMGDCSCLLSTYEITLQDTPIPYRIDLAASQRSGAC